MTLLEQLKQLEVEHGAVKEKISQLTGKKQLLLQTKDGYLSEIKAKGYTTVEEFRAALTKMESDMQATVDALSGQIKKASAAIEAYEQKQV